MNIARIRRTATAAALATAGAAGVLALSATPASASTVYYEWESEKSVNSFVMTAKDDVHGTNVGVAADTNSSMALWSATNTDGNYWTYQLKATQHFAEPLCLDVSGDSRSENAPIIVARCDGSVSQEWQEFAGQGRTNRLQNRLSNMYIFQPNGDESTVALRQRTLSGSGGPASHLLWTWRDLVL